MDSAANKLKFRDSCFHVSGQMTRNFPVLVPVVMLIVIDGGYLNDLAPDDRYDADDDDDEHEEEDDDDRGAGDDDADDDADDVDDVDDNDDDDHHRCHQHHHRPHHYCDGGHDEDDDVDEDGDDVLVLLLMEKNKMNHDSNAVGGSWNRGSWQRRMHPLRCRCDSTLILWTSHGCCSF